MYVLALIFALFTSLAAAQAAPSTADVALLDARDTLHWLEVGSYQNTEPKYQWVFDSMIDQTKAEIAALEREKGGNRTPAQFAACRGGCCNGSCSRFGIFHREPTQVEDAPQPTVKRTGPIRSLLHKRRGSADNISPSSESTDQSAAPPKTSGYYPYPTPYPYNMARCPRCGAVFPIIGNGAKEKTYKAPKAPVDKVAPNPDAKKSAGCGCGCPECTGKPGCPCKCKDCTCNKKTADSLSEDESRMVAAINAFRADQKLPPLTVDPILQRVARERIVGARMDHNHARYGYSPDHAVRRGFRARRDGILPMVSDNLVFGGGLSPEQAVVAWEESHVGHRENLLGNWEAKHDGKMLRIKNAFNRVGVAHAGGNYIAVFGETDADKQASAREFHRRFDPTIWDAFKPGYWWTWFGAVHA